MESVFVLVDVFDDFDGNSHTIKLVCPYDEDLMPTPIFSSKEQAETWRNENRKILFGVPDIIEIPFYPTCLYNKKP